MRCSSVYAVEVAKNSKAKKTIDRLLRERAIDRIEKEVMLKGNKKAPDVGQSKLAQKHGKGKHDGLQEDSSSLASTYKAPCTSAIKGPNSGTVAGVRAAGGPARLQEYTANW